jgi:hypothetical protein
MITMQSTGFIISNIYSLKKQFSVHDMSTNVLSIMNGYYEQYTLILYRPLLIIQASFQNVEWACESKQITMDYRLSSKLQNRSFSS